MISVMPLKYFLFLQIVTPKISPLLHQGTYHRPTSFLPGYLVDVISQAAMSAEISNSKTHGCVAIEIADCIPKPVYTDPNSAMQTFLAHLITTLTPFTHNTGSTLMDTSSLRLLDIQNKTRLFLQTKKYKDFTSDFKRLTQDMFSKYFAGLWESPKLMWDYVNTHRVPNEF